MKDVIMDRHNQFNPARLPTDNSANAQQTLSVRYQNGVRLWVERSE